MSVVVKRLDGSRCYLMVVEVGLSPVDVVLDGDLALPPLKGHDPSFRLMSLVAKRLDG